MSFALIWVVSVLDAGSNEQANLHPVERAFDFLVEILLPAFFQTESLHLERCRCSASILARSFDQKLDLPDLPWSFPRKTYIRPSTLPDFGTDNPIMGLRK